MFAEKFVAGDLQRLLKETGLVIEAGTAAILMEGGQCKGVLDPGRYTFDGLLRKVNWWGDPPPRTVVLVENGDVVIPLRIEGVRMADGFPVEFYTEVALRFAEKGAEAFLENLYKNREQLLPKEIAEILEREIVHAVQNLCNTTNMEDMVKDPQRRTRLEDELNEVLARTLKRYGLEIVRVPSAEFTGKEYEELAEKSGQLEIKRRELEFGQRLRELVSGDRMHGFKNEHEVEEYIRQLAQEKNISAELRDQQIKILLQVQRHELGGAEVAWQMAREMEKVSHEIGVKLKWDDDTRHKLVADAKLQAEVKTIQVEAEVDEVTKWLDVRAKKQAIKRQDLAETAKIPDGQSIETRVDLIDDPAKREHLLELNRQAGISRERTRSLTGQAINNQPINIGWPYATTHGEFEDKVQQHRDQVDCTVYAPPDIHAGTARMIQVYAHRPEDADGARKMAQEFDLDTGRRGVTSLGTQIAQGSVLRFELEVPGISIEEPVQQLVWMGRTGSVQYLLHVPKSLELGDLICKLSVCQESVPIGRILFKISVLASKNSTGADSAFIGQANRYSQAFISYASKDRAEVLRRVQMLQSVGIRYYQDLFDMTPGAHWEQELYRHIDESDIMFLFWSSAAKTSDWVQKEWQYGLAKKGEDYIRPVIIEGPPIPEPPPELQHIHFGDKLLYFLK